MSVPEMIKKYRIQAELKQSDLGNLLGKAPSVIANWEAGTNKPDVNSVGRMLEIFGIDANTFFEWNETQKEKPITTEGDRLTDKEREYLRLYRAAPSEMQDAFLMALEAVEDARLARDSSAKDK